MSETNKDTGSPPQRKTWRGRLRSLIAPAIVLGAVIVVVVVIMFLPARDRTAEPTPPPPVNVDVLVLTPMAEVADTFTLTAVVTPNRVVDISAEVAGRIEEIVGVEGSRVAAGDVLMRLDTDLLRPALDGARAAVTASEARVLSAKVQAEYDGVEFARIESSYKQGAASESEYVLARSKRDLSVAARATAEAQLLVDKAALRQAQVNLDNAEIHASFDGTLNRVLLKEGSYVAVGTPLLQIVDMGVARIAVDVPERDLPSLKPGDEVRITVDRALDAPALAGRDRPRVEVVSRADGGQTVITDRIDYIAAIADPATRSTRTEVWLPNETLGLKDGQFVRMQLTRAVHKDVIVIPLLAAIPQEREKFPTTQASEDEDRKVVYVVENGLSVRKEVVLGFYRGQSRQVIDGLKPGDELIIRGQQFVAPDKPVAVRNRIAEGASTP